MRYSLLSFLCLITLIAYVQRSAMNGATKAIENDLRHHFDRSRDGHERLVSSLLAVPVARRLGRGPDRQQARALDLCGWVVGANRDWRAWPRGWLGLLLAVGLMGAMQAGIFPSCTKAIGATFPKSEQAIASGATGVLHEPWRRARAPDHGTTAWAVVVAADLHPLRGSGPGLGGAIRRHRPATGAARASNRAAGRTAPAIGRRLARIAARSRNSRRTRAMDEAHHRPADASPLLPAVSPRRRECVSSTPGSPASSRKPRGLSRASGGSLFLLAALRWGIRRSARRPLLGLDPLAIRKHATRRDRG